MKSQCFDVNVFSSTKLYALAEAKEQRRGSITGYSRTNNDEKKDAGDGHNSRYRSFDKT